MCLFIAATQPLPISSLASILFVCFSPLTYPDFTNLVLSVFYAAVGEIVKAGHTEKHKVIKCLCYGLNVIAQLGIQPETFVTGILMSSGKRFPSTLFEKFMGMCQSSYLFLKTIP